MPDISFYEQGVALMDATPLRPFSVFESYIWARGQSTGFESLVLRMLEAKDTIAPGVFADDPVAGQLDNKHDCSQDDHARRVAWFVLHGHEQFQCTASMMPHSQANQPITLYVEDGNHRLAAAVLTNRPILLKLQYGSIVDVESFAGFIQWESKPTVALRFGRHIVSDRKQSWEVVFDEVFHRLYVNDVLGRCRVKLQLGFAQSLMLYSDWQDLFECGDSLIVTGHKLTASGAIGLLKERVSEIFGEPRFEQWFHETVGGHFELGRESALKIVT